MKLVQVNDKQANACVSPSKISMQQALPRPLPHWQDKCCCAACAAVLHVEGNASNNVIHVAYVQRLVIKPASKKQPATQWQAGHSGQVPRSASCNLSNLPMLPS